VRVDSPRAGLVVTCRKEGAQPECHPFCTSPIVAQVRGVPELFSGPDPGGQLAHKNEQFKKIWFLLELDTVLSWCWRFFLQLYNPSTIEQSRIIFICPPAVQFTWMNTSNEITTARHENIWRSKMQKFFCT
jgi:hypothetical protein